MLPVFNRTLFLQQYCSMAGVEMLRLINFMLTFKHKKTPTGVEVLYQVVFINLI